MEIENCVLHKIGYERFETVVKMVGGKWKLKIIFILAFHEVLRYGELKRMIHPITHKMLSSQLKELEKDGLVIREEYQQIPPKVEYSLSPMGRDLRPIVELLGIWIMNYTEKIEQQD